MKQTSAVKSLFSDDVLGRAILDYYNGHRSGKLWIHNTYGPKEEMPVATYFRNKESMPILEIVALEQCNGKILDIGSGAGSHALELQKKEQDVTALEISARACEVMKDRGVKNILQEDILSIEYGTYDTLLLLMNGIGLTGTVNGIRAFLKQARQLIVPTGQLLFDSSDVAYLYDPAQLKKMDHYYGEISYRYEYKRVKTGWFTWLYIDQQSLINIANEEGWLVEILFVDEYDQYLARLKLKI